MLFDRKIIERREMEEIKNVEIDFQQNVKTMILKRLLKTRAINKPTYTRVIKKLETKEE